MPKVEPVLRIGIIVKTSITTLGKATIKVRVGGFTGPAFRRCAGKARIGESERTSTVRCACLLQSGVASFVGCQSGLVLWLDVGILSRDTFHVLCVLNGPIFGFRKPHQS